MNDFSESRKKKKKRAIVRPIVRGQKCRELLGSCLNNSLGAMIFTGILCFIGVSFSLFSCIYTPSGTRRWPIINMLCALSPLIPLLIGGGISEILRIASPMSDELVRDRHEWLNAGWIITGLTILLAFISPIIVDKLVVLPETIVWTSAIGSWFLVTTIIFTAAFFIKLTRSGNGTTPYEYQYESDSEEE